MTHYWIAVASKNHVMQALSHGFAQAGHGKRSGIARMHKGDMILYYSPKVEYEGDKPLHAFTAMGVIADDEIFQVEENPDWMPFRRRVEYKWSGEVRIEPLINELSFIKNKAKWGSVFRFGILEIPREDFERISGGFGVLASR